MTTVHYWSPQLHFRIEDDEFAPGQTILAGLIGPKPKVWTMFVFIYAFFGTTGFFISMYGFSKWMLGEFSPFVWALPITFVFMLSAYLARRWGESLGHDQVEVLKQFVRDVVNNQKGEIISVK